MVEAIEAPQPPFGPPDTQVRVKSKWLKPDQVDYWEGAPQCLFYKLCLKMIDHSSKIHGAQVFPDLDFGSKSVLCPY